MTDPCKTPLYAVQEAANARFVPFAGFQMAVQFSGVVAEHTAVRERVGLFDVSHMGEVVVEGPAARDAMQYLVTNNLAKLTPGRAQYTVMCVPDGGIVDDLGPDRRQPVDVGVIHPDPLEGTLHRVIDPVDLQRSGLDHLGPRLEGRPGLAARQHQQTQYDKHGRNR